jgi:hypothetical protein
VKAFITLRPGQVIGPHLLDEIQATTRRIVGGHCLLPSSTVPIPASIWSGASRFTIASMRQEWLHPALSIERTRTFEHDASILAGHSGSMVTDFADGSTVIGLHLGGGPRRQNYSHAFATFKSQLVGLGVNYAE